MRYRLVDGLLEPVSTTSSPIPPAPLPRRRRLDRYVCGASSCSFRTWSYAAAERHADEHGGARIAVDLELVEAAYEAAS